MVGVVQEVPTDAASGARAGEGEIKELERVYVPNFDRLLCTCMPICDPVIDGHIARFDNQRITPIFVSLASEGDQLPPR